MCVPNDELFYEDAVESLDHAVEQAERERDETRAQVETEFPVIATYTSGDEIDLAGLERLATAPNAAAIGEDARAKLANIARVRGELGDDLSLWERPELVALASQRMHVLPESWQARAVEERMEAESDSWGTWAILAISIGLGLLAAIPTAGASLGVTALVVTAEVAGLALDAYLLYESVQEYELALALTNTDFDRARIISHEEPSLFWLALDLVGTAIGAAGALHTFSSVARARRAALAARTAAEVAERIEEARRLARAAGLAEDVVTRLTDEIVRSHPERSVIEEVTRALARGDEIAPAAEVAARMGGSLTDVVTPTNIDAMSRELGAIVEIVPDLGEEIRVLPRLGRRGQVGVRAVQIGEAASLGDILAHREVIGLMRRYEGLTAEAARMWDELIGGTVEAGGRINPFPPGSQAYNSWFELRRYPERIQSRVARLGDAVDPHEADLLREDLEVFQSELAHHRRTVGDPATMRMRTSANVIEEASAGEGLVEAAGRVRNLDELDARVLDERMTASGFFDERRGLIGEPFLERLPGESIDAHRRRMLGEIDERLGTELEEAYDEAIRSGRLRPDEEWSGFYFNRLDSGGTRFDAARRRIVFTMDRSLSKFTVAEEVQHALDYIAGARSTREMADEGMRALAESRGITLDDLLSTGLTADDAELINRWWHRRVFTRLIQNIHENRHGLGYLRERIDEVWALYREIGGRLTLDEILTSTWEGLY